MSNSSGLQGQKQAANCLSLAQVKCPKCGGNDFTVSGQRGRNSRAMGALLFGVTKAATKEITRNDNIELDFRCMSCKTKFRDQPSLAQEDERLDKACKIVFSNNSSLDYFHIWLNGVDIGVINRGSKREVFTYIRSNYVFLTADNGSVFKVKAGNQKFEAQPDGNISIVFGGGAFGLEIQ